MSRSKYFRRAGLNYDNWETLAQDRPIWRTFASGTMQAFERQRDLDDEGWCRRRKEVEQRRNKIPASCGPTEVIKL